MGKSGVYRPRKILGFEVWILREYAQSFFLAQKSNQNTWFSATLVFSLVFRWFSAVSPTLCTVVSKKTKLSCFGGFFFLGFLNPSNCLVFLELFTCCNKDKIEILLFIYIFSKLYITKKILNISVTVKYIFCKQTNKVPPPPTIFSIHNTQNPPNLFYL